MPRASHRITAHRILYAGDDVGLPERLQDELWRLDCLVVRSHVGTARLFLRSDIRYSLLLFDETAEGVELQDFARSLPHHEQTPVILFKKSEGTDRLLDAVRRQLGKPRAS